MIAQPTAKKWRHGFSLAELLIALAILGVIATFTIPKILAAQQADKRKAVFRETYSALSQALYNSVLLTRSVGDTDSYWTYLQTNLNALKFCTHADTDGCWPGSTDNGSLTSSNPGILMHNGSMVLDFTPGASSDDNLWIDWNGTDGPNLQCQDQIPLVYFVQTGTKGGISGQAGQIKYRINPPGNSSISCDPSVFDSL